MKADSRAIFGRSVNLAANNSQSFGSAFPGTAGSREVGIDGRKRAVPLSHRAHDFTPLDLVLAEGCADFDFCQVCLQNEDALCRIGAGVLDECQTGSGIGGNNFRPDGR